MNLKWKYKDIDVEVLVDNPITDNFNEELNSATVLIENLSEPLNVEILDEVKLGNKYYFCISDYEERKVNPNEPHYDYTIELVSQTKLLEGVILPNLNITKTDKNLSVLDYIERYMDLYCPKIRKGTTNSWTWENKWTRSREIDGKFKNIKCPEMQWNRPTLREVLTDLMMTADCIPVLEDGVLGLLDLSKRLNPINETKINYINKSRSLSDYATEIEMELQNVLQSDADNVYNLTNAVEFLGFRNEDNYTVNTENVSVQTKNQIYNIKHFWLCFRLHIEYVGFIQTREQYNYVEIDLCNINGINLVKEYKEYMTLPVAYDTSDTATFEAMSNYQNFNLSYVRGSKEINGMFDVTKKFWFINKTLLELILEKVVDELKNPQSDEIVYWTTKTGSVTNGTFDIGDFGFKIEYQCLANTKFKAGKYLPYENDRIIVDNQTNSYVDAEKQGILEYLKANRLGNELLIMTARYDNLNEVEKVGNIYNEDYVIFKSQIQINPNYVSANYYAIKHYILRNYFTGIKAKIRSWKIDDENCLIRNELHKYYYEFSFEDKLVDDGNLPVSPKKMLSPFLTHFSFEIVKYVFINTEVRDFVYYPSDYTGGEYWYIECELNNKVLGNAVVLNTQMQDNYSGGVYLDTIQLIDDVDYNVEKDTRYVDTRGEFEKAHMYLCDEKKVNHSGSDQWVFPSILVAKQNFNYSNVTATVFGNLDSVMKKKPFATLEILNESSGNLYTEEYLVFKDQREITALTLQLEYCTDSPDIVFGSQLVRDNNLSSTHYREMYEPVEGITPIGDLKYFDVYSNESSIPAATVNDVGLYVIAQNSGSYYYYVGRLKPVSYSLKDTTIRTVAQINALGAGLTGLYAIGKEAVQSYPEGLDPSTKKQLAFTDVFEGTYELNNQRPAGNYGYKYAVAWTYDSVRILDTFTIEVVRYTGKSVGDSIEAASTNDRYKVVQHLVDPKNGFLASRDVIEDISLLPLNANVNDYIVCNDIDIPSSYDVTIYSTTVYRYSDGLPTSGPSTNEHIVVLEDVGNVYPWQRYQTLTKIKYTFHAGGQNIKLEINPISSSTAEIYVNNGESVILVAGTGGWETQNGNLVSSMRIRNYESRPVGGNYITVEVLDYDGNPTSYYVSFDTTTISVNQNSAYVINDQQHVDLWNQMTKPGTGKYQWYGWNQWDGFIFDASLGEADTQKLCKYRTSTYTYYYWNPSEHRFTDYTAKTLYLFKYIDSTYRWSNTWTKMSSIATNTETFRYSNNNVYWNSIRWENYNIYEYQLLYSTGGYWILNNVSYATDTTNIYKAENSSNYYKWINGQWSLYTGDNKKYYWYLSSLEHGNFKWFKLIFEVQLWEYAWIGTDYTRPDTEWYYWTRLNHWYFVSNTLIEDYYYLYTYDNGIVQKDSSFLRSNKFRYSNENYVWNVEDYATNRGSWVPNNVYEWNPVDIANGLYFRYQGNIYQFDSTTHQLIYTESQTPITDTVRTDSRFTDESKNRLYLLAADDKVRVYDMDYLPQITVEIDDWSLSAITSNYIDINLGTYPSETKAFYIVDSQNRVLLAFNKPSTTTTTQRIYLNGYRSRNKKIYN